MILRCLAMSVLISSILGQVDVPHGIRPDITFGESNDRFDIRPVLEAQKYFFPEGPQDELEKDYFRRYEEMVNGEKNQRRSFLDSDVASEPKNSLSQSSADDNVGKLENLLDKMQSKNIQKSKSNTLPDVDALTEILDSTQKNNRNKKGLRASDASKLPDFTQLEKVVGREEALRICRSTGYCGCGRACLRSLGLEPTKDKRNDNIDDKTNNEEDVKTRNYAIEALLDNLEAEVKVGRHPHKLQRTSYDLSYDDRADEDRGDADLTAKLESRGTKFRLNENLDAIVVQLDDLNDLLSKDHSRNSKLKRVLSKLNHKSDDITAVVLNLDDNGNVKSTNPLEEHLESLANREDKKEVPYLLLQDAESFYHNRKAQVLNLILEYITDRSGRKKPVEALTLNQKLRVEKLKRLYKNGLRNGKDLRNDVNEILVGKYSTVRILPHKGENDNIYISQSLYDAALSDKLRNRDRGGRNKLRPYGKLGRRNVAVGGKDDIRVKNTDNTPAQPTQKLGVPFELGFQGLAQVNP